MLPATVTSVTSHRTSIQVLHWSKTAIDWATGQMLSGWGCENVMKITLE